MIFVSIFLLGLAVGSFLNAFLYRLELQHGLRLNPQGGKKADVTVLRGRSFCPSCGHTLAWYDLIPLLSFLLLQGRCRYCEERISFQYPFVELATGLLFVAIFALVAGKGLLSFSQILEIVYLWIIASSLMVIFVYDLKHFIIPDKVLFPALGLVLVWRIGEGVVLGAIPWNPLVAGIGAAAFFFLLYFVSKGTWMGFGDVKLALFMGLFLGFPNILVALFFSFVVGAAIGLALILLKKKQFRSEVPFAPFLVLGTFVALFWGEKLVDMYLGLVL